MKSILVIWFVCVILTIPGMQHVPAEQLAHSDDEWSYLLSYGDVVQEVHRQFVGEALVPWAPGYVGQKFVSKLLTIRDGFWFSPAFFNHWQSALTQSMVHYWNFTAEHGLDFGWASYHRANCSGEDSFIKFRNPLTLWKVGESSITSTAPASIMKYDTIELFAPETTEQGKPELEGQNMTATLTCINCTTQTNLVSLQFSLVISGNGIIRFHNPQGPFLGDDKNETCAIVIARDGAISFAKENDTGLWIVLHEHYTEVWHAQSLVSDVMINESRNGGPHDSYDLVFTEIPQRTQPAIPLFDVRDYGAVGDGKTLDTVAINTAIATCAHNGGGVVYFPPGTYLSGSLHLNTNVTLSLDARAILRATRDMTKYDPREYNPWAKYQDSSQSSVHRSLIWGENLTNVGILGSGLIDGNDAFEPWPVINRTFPPPFSWIFSTIFYQINDTIFQRGAKPLALKSCRNVFIKDIRITHAADESVFLAGCDDVLILGYKALAQRVDGIDPVCCHNVTITHCEIRSLDDAIAIKSSYILGFKRSCENITVEHCVLCSFINALKIGTESVGDFRHITFRDCIVRDSSRLPSYAGISVISVDGGAIDGVTVSEITLLSVNYPIFIRLGDRLRSPEHPSVGNIQNITICDLLSLGAKKASSITAVPGTYVGGNITMRNVTIMCMGGGLRISSLRNPPERRESNGVYPDPPYILPGTPPAYGFFCRHVNGLSFIDVSLGFERRDLRAAVICVDVDDLLFHHFHAERLPLGAPSVIIKE